MEPISKKQIGLIKTVCTRLKLESADLALDYSNLRTDRVSHLTKDEATQLIKWLLNTTNTPPSPKELMVRKIISMAHELHWEKPHGKRPGKSNAIDMEKVDSWCIRYGQFHKPLDQHDITELPKLVTQFQNAHKDFLKAV